ncbi:MAG: DinB family protein, partial [Actinobacteria bacterium]|nr:DinB family protein [Actinomycetota bacterium]
MLRDRRARFAAVLDELDLSLDSDDDLKRRVGGGWTLAEHLVHIAAWERRYGRVVSRAPKLPYPSNWQAFNDAVFAEWKGVTPVAARAEYA